MRSKPMFRMMSDTLVVILSCLALIAGLDGVCGDEADVSIGAYFVHKSVIIPHDDKIHRGGEDAASTSDRFLVVADGVGGWARHGVNPGLYSKMLTEQVVALGHQNMSLPLENIVDKANWMTAEKHLGSATCTTLKLTSPDEITTLNVGDSGYSIHRRNDKDELELVFASEAGQKSFNFPYQLGGQYGDEVKDVAVEKHHILKQNDIIVVYSDGVSDNVFPPEFHPCLDRASDEEDGFALASFSLAADCIARKAYFLGKDKTFDSPFAQGARESGKRYIGGKHDDITVVVAQVRAGDVPLPLEDPFFQEAITLYTGPVESEDMLPTVRDLLVSAGGGDEL